jgi:hypothetical protein
MTLIPAVSVEEDVREFLSGAVIPKVSRPLTEHPVGGLPGVDQEISGERLAVDTDAGPVHVEWDPVAAVTSLGYLAFFTKFLKVSGRFDAFFVDCPLLYTSPNAPSKRDVVGYDPQKPGRPSHAYHGLLIARRALGAECGGGAGQPAQLEDPEAAPVGAAGAAVSGDYPICTE